MNWMQGTYFRLLVDNHISDIDARFMSRFDPGEYARLAQRAGVGTAMVSACCHNGNCYYPTRVGHPHANLNGRDVFGETVNRLRESGIVPMAYYTITFQNDAAKNHPEWRMRDCLGKERDGRYWYACINHPDYISHVKEQLSEIAAYPVVAIFIDMPFWPLVCQCDPCRSKYRAETGCDIPSVIDWRSPEWVRFQRARERWMGEAVAGLRAHLKGIRPDLAVVYNLAPVLHGWLLAQTGEVTQASDFSSGDFYGGRHQQRLGCKILAAYSRSIPYEFMTSRCVTLYDHTSTKSEDEMVMHCLTTLSNGGAALLIDAINPDGTLNEGVYDRMEAVGRRIAPFRRVLEKHAPVLSADCGLWFSAPCNVDETLNGKELCDYAANESHMAATSDTEGIRQVVLNECLGTSVLLGRLKIPYRVVTETTATLDGLGTLIINNAAYMDACQVERVREFVLRGGTLIATGKTSLYTLEGDSSGDFQLADVFGVQYAGLQTGAINYLELKEDPANSLLSQGEAPLCRATTAEVLGRVVEPYFPYNDPDRYASIHSNPPGVRTEYAGLTLNRFGKGCCIWIFSSLLKHQQAAQQQFGRDLLEKWIESPLQSSENLHDAVEATFLKSTTGAAWLLGLVNYQAEEPVVPLFDVQLRIRLPEGGSPCRVTRVSDGGDQPFYTLADGRIEVVLPALHEAEMLEMVSL